MKYEDKFTSLELSMKLKELGIQQKSLFYWEYLDERAYSLKYFIHTVLPRNEDLFKHFSAFSSDELMDLLPAFVDIKKNEPFNNFWLKISKHRAKNIQYSIKYICDTHAITSKGFTTTVEFGGKNIYDENLANALAKMLIHLLEENLYVKLEPIDINKIDR